jgi:hypothetical protein
MEYGLLSLVPFCGYVARLNLMVGVNYERVKVVPLAQLQ